MFMLLLLLKEYLAQTKIIRAQEKALLICYIKPHKAVSRAILELGLDIVKTNILTNFHQNRVANVASRV